MNCLAAVCLVIAVVTLISSCGKNQSGIAVDRDSLISHFEKMGVKFKPDSADSRHLTGQSEQVPTTYINITGEKELVDSASAIALLSDGGEVTKENQDKVLMVATLAMKVDTTAVSWMNDEVNKAFQSSEKKSRSVKNFGSRKFVFEYDSDENLTILVLRVVPLSM